MMNKFVPHYIMRQIMATSIIGIQFALSDEIADNVMNFATISISYNIIFLFKKWENNELEKNSKNIIILMIILIVASLLCMLDINKGINKIILFTAILYNIWK